MKLNWNKIIILKVTHQSPEFIPPSRITNNSTTSPSFYSSYSINTTIVNGNATTPTKPTVYASTSATSYSITPVKSKFFCSIFKNTQYLDESEMVLSFNNVTYLSIISYLFRRLLVSLVCKITFSFLMSVSRSHYYNKL